MNVTRTELLNAIYAGRTRLEAVLLPLTPAQMTEPALPGGWSVKDLVAHLGWWEQRVAAMYHEGAAGKEPSEPANSDALDALNARILQEFRARDLMDVREFEQTAYHDLLNLVETAPEADLFDSRRFAWTRGRPFMDLVTDNSSGHFEEHLPDLEALLAEDRDALRPPAGAAPPVEDAHLNPVVRRAKAFLESEGRDIERALFDFRFGALPTEGVLDVLARYQNPDGGFYGLEFDIRAPQSNPFATELALNILVWLDPPRDHPLIQRTLAYLETTQAEDGSWRFDPEIYRYDLAPWFKGWQWPNLNPTCTTAGFLKLLGLGSNRLHTRAQTLFDQLANPADLTGTDFYNARPYALYLQTEWDFPQADLYRWGVVWWLVRQHATNPTLDATHFMEYAPRPESAVARRLPPAVLQAKLAQVLAEQAEDGGWPTPYAAHWRSWATIQNLLVLRAYGQA